MKARGEKGDRGSGGYSITISRAMNLSRLWEIEDRGARLATVHGVQRIRHDLATELQEVRTNKRGDLIRVSRGKEVRFYQIGFNSCF